MKKVCILIKFRAKIALKRRALRDVIMLLLMTSLEKERETAVKSVMKRVSYWKIYEMALWKGKSCDKRDLCGVAMKNSPSKSLYKIIPFQ